MKTTGTANREKNSSQFLESFSAATDRRHDWSVVDIDDAGRGKRRSVRHVGHEQVNRLIRVNSSKRVFTKWDRQPRAFQHRPRHRLRLRPRPRFITRIARSRFGRVAWCRCRCQCGGGGGGGGGGGPDTPPYVARAFAVRDEHTQGGHGFEHGKRVAFRLVERVFFLFRA